MSISYEEALATLEGMFGENWSRDDLDTVLRNQQGHMENTVDLILTHGERSPSSLIEKINAGEDPRAAAIDADAELARQLANPQRTVPAAPAPAPPSQAGRRGTPTDLPPEFLRIPSAVPTSTSTDQLQSDEALARMLQDKMFSEEISRNPDFAHLARGSNTRAASSQRVRDSAGRGNGAAQPAFKPPDVDAVMKSLGNLGMNARSRLQLMAAQFNKARGVSNGNTAAAAEAQGGSTAERRGLLDGESNDDEVALEFASRKDL